MNKHPRDNRVIVRPAPLRTGVFAAALFAAGQAAAIGFGDIILHSRVGEPLRAEVPINVEPGESIDGACFSLAPLNGSDLPVVSSARTKLLREGDRYRLHITGSKPIGEPIFLVGLRAGCGVDLQRDYVLMPAEPVVFADARPLPPPVASAEAAESADAGGGSRSSAAAIKQWQAGEGETLENIAETLVPDNLAQQRRMLAALKRANPRLAGRPSLAEGTPVVIPDLSKRIVAERDTLPMQQVKAPKETAPPPPPPPPKPKPKPVAKSAKPADTSAAKPKAGGPDRVMLGAPPAELKAGEQPAPPKDPRAELNDRMRKLEDTIASLNTQIEALDKALALTSESMELRKKLEAAKASAGGAPAPIARPPEPAAASGSNWLEIIGSALAGGLIAAGFAHYLGRRRERRVEREMPLAVATRASATRSESVAMPAAAPVASRAALAAALAARDDFSRPPEDLPPVDVSYSHDESAIALAEIMLTFGRHQAAAETLARHIEESAPSNPRPWLMLLDLYRRANLRGEYTRLQPAIRQRFNLAAPAWEDLHSPAEELKSLEDYPHVLQRVTTSWGTGACMDYLDRLIHDTRDGLRGGFPLEVIEEIVLLQLLLEDGHGIRRP
jgi:Tfp pilus assembly protein FimV